MLQAVEDRRFLFFGGDRANLGQVAGTLCLCLLELLETKRYGSVACRTVFVVLKHLVVDSPKCCTGAAFG